MKTLIIWEINIVSCEENQIYSVGVETGRVCVCSNQLNSNQRILKGYTQ